MEVYLDNFNFTSLTLFIGLHEASVKDYNTLMCYFILGGIPLFYFSKHILVLGPSQNIIMRVCSDLIFQYFHCSGALVSFEIPVRILYVLIFLPLSWCNFFLALFIVPWTSGDCFNFLHILFSP